MALDTETPSRGNAREVGKPGETKNDLRTVKKNREKERGERGENKWEKKLNEVDRQPGGTRGRCAVGVRGEINKNQAPQLALRKKATNWLRIKKKGEQGQSTLRRN